MVKVFSMLVELLSRQIELMANIMSSIAFILLAKMEKKYEMLNEEVAHRLLCRKVCTLEQSCGKRVLSSRASRLSVCVCVCLLLSQVAKVDD